VQCATELRDNRPRRIPSTPNWELHGERTARSHGLTGTSRRGTAQPASAFARGPYAREPAIPGARHTLHRMVSRCFSVCGLLAALVLLVVGCSNGSGSHATATTTIATTSSTAGTTTTVSPQVVANLGRCPKTSLAAEGLVAAKLNMGIRNLAPKLVPINVQSVRICDYLLPAGGLRDVVLNSREAVQFTDDTNKIRTPNNLDSCPAGLTDFLIFANSTQHVSLFDYCGYHLGNGTIGADAPPKWVNELLCYADYGSTPPRSCLARNGPTGPSG